LTGKMPFEGDSVLDTLERIKTMQMRPLREACPGVPAELEAVCLACLEKSPGDRPTAAELARRLEAAGQAVQQERAARREGEAPAEPQRSDKLGSSTPARPRIRWLMPAGVTV